MRAFFLLSILAAHAAATPCDPKCDPRCDPKAKAKAQATVVVVDPQARIRTTNGSGQCGTEVSTTTAAQGGLVSVGRGSCSSKSPSSSSCNAAKAVASTSGSGLVSSYSHASSPASCTEPVVVRVEPDMQSLSGLAELVRGARAGGQGTQVMDEETRESVRAALEEAREAAREAIEEARESTRAALEDAREAQREAQVEARSAHRKITEEVGAAMREAADAQAEAERKVAAELDEVRRENPQAFEALGFANAAEVQALTQEAWKTARKALAEVWTDTNLPESYYVYSDANSPDDADAEDSEDLEDRVRALENMARAKGHATTDGSLEERVAALEQALAGGSKARAPRATKLRAPRAFTYPTPDGQGFRELKLDGQPRAIRVPSKTWRVAPMAPVAPVPPVAEVQPVPPVAPVAPFTTTPPPVRAWSFPGTPAPAAPPAASDDRRAIEEAMRSLRDEAESLRGELMRMREQMESLPRKSDR